MVVAFLDPAGQGYAWDHVGQQRASRGISIAEAPKCQYVATEERHTKKTRSERATSGARKDEGQAKTNRATERNREVKPLVGSYRCIPHIGIGAASENSQRTLHGKI